MGDEQEATGAARGVHDRVGDRRLDGVDDRADQVARGEVLTSS
jgi:hypothetical protein